MGGTVFLLIFGAVNHGDEGDRAATLCRLKSKASAVIDLSW